MTAPALWTTDAMVSAMGAERFGALPEAVFGLSIDSRSLAPGDAFFAIQGDNRDGHDFVAAALSAKAGLAVIAADRRSQFPGDAPLLV
ncbi:MAG: Mur ligase domain-containing protein, partial [Xanthobacteraceae bacterium]